MKDLERRLRTVVNMAQRDTGMEPEDADLIRSAFQQAVALDPKDDCTPERVGMLVGGMADVVDGSEDLSYGVEMRRYLAAFLPSVVASPVY